MSSVERQWLRLMSFVQTETSFLRKSAHLWLRAKKTRLWHQFEHRITEEFEAFVVLGPLMLV